MTKLTIRNDFTDRETTIDTTRPLTVRRIAEIRRRLVADDCASGDDLGARGPQDDQEAYDRFALRASSVIAGGTDEPTKIKDVWLHDYLGVRGLDESEARAIYEAADEGGTIQADQMAALGFTPEHCTACRMVDALVWAGGVLLDPETGEPQQQQ